MDILFLGGTEFSKLMIQQAVDELGYSCVFIDDIETYKPREKGLCFEVLFIFWNNTGEKYHNRVREVLQYGCQSETPVVIVKEEPNNEIGMELSANLIVIDGPLTKKTLSTTIDRLKKGSDEKKYRPSKKIYSLETVNEFADGDETFVKQVLTVFVNDTPTAIEKMNEAFQAQDWKHLREVAHKYKSHVSMLMINSAIETVKKIEKCADEKTNLADVPVLINELNGKCLSAIKAIEKDFDLQNNQ